MAMRRHSSTRAWFQRFVGQLEPPTQATSSDYADRAHRPNNSEVLGAWVLALTVLLAMALFI